MRKRRVVLGVAAVAVLTVLVGVLVVHAPPIQRKVRDLLYDELSRRTCLEIRSAGFSFRLWPAYLEVTDLEVKGTNGELVRVDSLHSSWRWIRLLGDTPRLDQLGVRGLALDLDRLPRPCGGEEAPDRPLLERAEIDHFTLDKIEVIGQFEDLSLKADGLILTSSLGDGRIEVAVRDLGLEVVRLGRPLTLGVLSASLDGTTDQVEVTDFRLSDGALSIDLEGLLSQRPGPAASAAFSAVVPVDAVVAWAAPEQGELLDVAGSLNLEGTLTWDTDLGLQIDAVHSGSGLRAAGYDIDRVDFQAGAGRFQATAGGDDWGLLRGVRQGPDGTLQCSLELDNADPVPLLETLGQNLPTPALEALRLSGKAQATIPIPFDPGTLSARAALRADFLDGSANLTATMKRGNMEVERFAGTAHGVLFSGAGSVDGDSRLSGWIEASSPDPAHLIRTVLPGDLSESVNGGAASARIDLAGSISSPSIMANVEWLRPEFFAIDIDRIAASAEGRSDALAWSITARPGEANTAQAAGTLNAGTGEIEGEFALSFDNLGTIRPPLTEDPVPALTGRVAASGLFQADHDGWRVQGTANSDGFTVDSLSVASLALEATAEPRSLTLNRLHAETLGGALSARGSLNRTETRDEIQLEAEWADLATTKLVPELPPEADLTLSGSLSLGGSLASPTARAELAWAPGERNLVFGPAGATAVLEKGRVRVLAPEVATAGGPLTLNADLPLGSFNRPSWLWPNAPGGAWDLTVDGQALDFSPFLSSLSIAGLDTGAAADLEMSAQWHPSVGGWPHLQMSLLDLSGRVAGEIFRATSPVRLAFDGEEIVVAETTLEGDVSTLSVGGRYHLTSTETAVDVRGSLQPEIARLLPLDLRIREPLELFGQVKGPLEKLSGSIRIRHDGGTIRLREPALRLENLAVEADIVDGTVDIRDGSAGLNQGQIYFGGGWDPEISQGLVAEFEKVTTVLPGGILSRWDGVLAVEPSRDRLALLIGDLTLQHGLWDQHFDLAGAILGRDSGSAGAEDFMHEIDLDLEVRNRGGVQVNNNLGVFDVRWNLLEIGGTAAVPRMVGDLKILPGGTLQVTGSPMKIRRGLVQFTGDPEIDPVLEIIPMQEAASVLGSTGDSAGVSASDAAAMGVSGLSAGLGTMLGLENTTIRPEEIAIETETDTSTEFSIGQQLGRSTALFLTTDLRNSQKRVTLLQLWRLAALPGLTIQAMTRTDTEEADLKLLQRFSWGGPAASKDRPQLRKVKLEGEWPLSKRKLRKATGLVRDQSWDPFLLFIGELRLETALARRGFPDSRVDGRIGGDEEYPTAIFSCDPGPRVVLTVEGADLPQKVRTKALSLYRFPPLELRSFRAMRSIAQRHLLSEGYPDATAEVSRSGEGELTMTVEAGRRVSFLGPEITGLPPASRRSVQALLTNPTELANLARDPERAGRIVRRVLASDGYRDVESVRSWSEAAGDGVATVHIEVVPGPRSTVAELALTGGDPLNVRSADYFDLEVGMPLDRQIIDRVVSNIRGDYRRNGYTDITVRTHLDPLSTGNWRLRIELEAGSTHVVDRIEINGTRHTSDDAILSGVSVEPGEVFRIDELDNTVVRLATFEPLDRVQASTRLEGSGLVVDLDVIEHARWTAEVGGGWNSDRGLTARLGIYDSNLFGRGIRAALRGRVEEDFLQGRFILALPPLPGGRFSAGINASYTEDVLEPEDEFDLLIHEHTHEATLEGNYQLRPGLWLRQYYRFSRTRTFEPEPFDPFFAIDVTTDLASLGGQILYDRLDNPFDPRSGVYLGLDMSWSGDAIGSDTENLRALFSGSLATEPRPGWTWFQSLRLGAARPLNGVLDRKSRFFAGGPSSIRGFRLDSVGPVEVLGGTTIFAGGEAMVVLNEEIRFPIWQALRGAVFVDAGQVWESWSEADGTFAIGAGLGLRFGTPIGPLWVDAAWPIAESGRNSGVRFSFGIGRTF